MSETLLRVADALEHQVREDRSPARFKLWHHGRRWGKDRLAFKGALLGHGPVLSDGRFTFQGALGSGKWVGWVVRDFTQGSNAWRTMFMPRLSGLQPLVTINRSEMRVTLPGGGGIFMCTAENIDSLRGLGEDMIGLVINEAAFFDLELAWATVLRALLTDNRGWAILMSSPNSGLDGNHAGVTPSYFNRRCHEAYADALGPEWGVFGGDLRANSKIDPEEAAAFLRDLTPGTLRYEEEGLGKLMQSGAGLAFPAWSPKVHLAPFHTPNPEHKLILGMDWGIRAVSAITALRVGHNGTITAFREWEWSDKDAYEAGFDFAQSLLDASLPRWPDMFVADSAMNERTGVGGTTIMGEFQSGINDALKDYRVPPLAVIGAPKGPGSRKQMFNQVTKVLAWGPALDDGTVPASRMPLFQIMRDQQGNPTCPKLAKDLASAVLDAKKQDEVDKAKTPGHHLESLGYPLSMILPGPDTIREAVPENIHPGFLPNGQRRSRDRTPEVLAEEQRVMIEMQLRERGGRAGNRYGRNPRDR